MPTDRHAPEKVAALRQRLVANDAMPSLSGYRALAIDAIDALVRALNAAGYDVARIEEGERLRAALEWALDYIEDTQAMRRPPLAEPFFGQKVAQGRAALAASDEAARP